MIKVKFPAIKIKGFWNIEQVIRTMQWFVSGYIQFIVKLYMIYTNKL